ncbi:MAG: class I tRNA ligase family protein, partial [Pseudomonadota bacterium]
EGANRFVQRVWRLVIQAGRDAATGDDDGLTRAVHKAIAAMTDDIDALRFNKLVARSYELAGAIEKAKPSAAKTEAIRTLVRLVAPAMPHLAEEAWAALGGDGLVADAAWPVADPARLVEDSATYAIQVNGKLRDTIDLAKGTPKPDVEAAALASEKVAGFLDGRTPKRVIVVPDRLVNLVI